MCEFCHKHGEGKKWYLQASNYSQDLKADLERRGSFDMKLLGKDMKRRQELKKAPFFMRALQEHRVVERIKNTHYGQVLPIEDVEQVFDIVNNVVRLECMCRKPRNVKEQRFCYGISLVPQDEEGQKVVNQPGSGFLSEDETLGMEQITKKDALENFRQYEKEGLCHSVWTALTPFIVGLCNCDRADCGAMQSTLVNDMPMMFRAEYVAELNPELCNGCRSCMRVCQFGAIGYSAGNKRAYIDQTKCFGCGICRSVCTQDAITLNDRTAVPVAAGLW